MRDQIIEASIRSLRQEGLRFSVDNLLFHAYRLIAGAGAFTAVYILSRAAGKIGCAWLGGKVTGASATVRKFLGFTLLPHSGVSLVFTGIAATTLTVIDPSLAEIVQGTIVAKYAFQWAGEIGPGQ